MSKSKQNAPAGTPDNTAPEQAATAPTKPARQRARTGKQQTPRTPTRYPNKRRTTSWKAGQSGNPNGRPKSGESLSEAVRESVSTKALIDRMKWLADNAESETVRYHALNWLAERGHGKAPQVVEFVDRNPYARRVKALKTEQLEALAAIDEPVEDAEPDGPATPELN